MVVTFIDTFYDLLRCFSNYLGLERDHLILSCLLIWIWEEGGNVYFILSVPSLYSLCAYVSQYYYAIFVIFIFDHAQIVREGIGYKAGLNF